MAEQHDFLTDALAEITGQLVSGERGDAVLQLVNDACIHILGVAATGILVVDPRGGVTVVAASDERARFVELLQSHTDEGPCLDSIRTRNVVNVPDLEAARGTWPTFAPAALEAGFRAVHALPMRLAGHAVGGLNLLHTSELWLTELQQRLAQTLADLAVLGLSQEPEVERRLEHLAEQTLTALNDRATLAQAVGLVAGAVDTDQEEARRVIVAYSRRHGQSLQRTSTALIDGSVDPATLAASEVS